MQLSFRPGVGLLAGVLGLGTFLTSCNGGGGTFSKTKSGIEYKLFKKEGGKYVSKELAGGEDPTFKARAGKFLLGHIYILTGKDSLVQSSREQVMGHAVPLPLQLVTKKGGQEEALSMVQPGDSAVFRFNADSLFKSSGRPVPKELKRSGNVLIMRIVGVKLVDQAEAMTVNQELQQVAQAEQMRKMRTATADQDKKDDAVLQDYIKKNNLTGAQKSPSGSGVYILVTQPGTGPNVKPGQTAKVAYRGTLLSGKEFDSSAKHGPFEFPVGQGRAIAGWDDAVQRLNKGSKATILVPSSQAYGAQGAGADIPANSPLRFELEVLDVTDGAPTAGMPAPAPAPRQ